VAVAHARVAPVRADRETCKLGCSLDVVEPKHSVDVVEDRPVGSRRRDPGEESIDEELLCLRNGPQERMARKRILYVKLLVRHGRLIPQHVISGTPVPLRVVR